MAYVAAAEVSLVPVKLNNFSHKLHSIFSVSRSSELVILCIAALTFSEFPCYLTKISHSFNTNKTNMVEIILSDDLKCII